MKDYVDIDTLIQAGVDLSTALAAGAAIYGAVFNPQITRPCAISTTRCLRHWQTMSAAGLSPPYRQSISIDCRV
jgi:hypothetical protein